MTARTNSDEATVTAAIANPALEGIDVQDDEVDPVRRGATVHPLQ